MFEIEFSVKSPLTEEQTSKIYQNKNIHFDDNGLTIILASSKLKVRELKAFVKTLVNKEQFNKFYKVRNNLI